MTLISQNCDTCIKYSWSTTIGGFTHRTCYIAQLSIIVIHLNGTSPSECRHLLCWHTKGHLWIEGCPKHYRWAYYELHFSSTQLVIFYLLNMSSPVWDSYYMQLTCCMWVSVVACRVQMCTQVTLRETRGSYASCQSWYPRTCLFHI